MASCQHVEIWKTQSSSRSPTRFDDVKADQKLIHQIEAKEDRDLCSLGPFPGRIKDGSTAPLDRERRQRGNITLKLRPPGTNLRVPEEVASSNNGDRRRVANVYVDGPVSTRLDCGAPTRHDGVKSPTSSAQRLDAGMRVHARLPYRNNTCSNKCVAYLVNTGVVPIR